MSLLRVSLAKIFRLLEKGEDWKAVEAGCSTKLSGLSGRSGLKFLSLKTSRVFSQVSEERTLSDVCEKLPTLGVMTCSGSLSILHGFYPRIESGYTLSELLEASPDAKYFLSNVAVKRLLSFKDNKLTALPPDTFPPKTGGRMLLNVNSIKKATSKNGQGARINTIYGNAVSLQSSSGGQGAKTGLYCVPRGKREGGFKDGDVCPTITSNSFQQNNFVVPVLTPDRVNKRQNGRRFKDAGDPAFTLTAQDRHGVFDGIDVRRLTPVECERLQGFPDGWTAEGVDGKRMSDSSRYKALGNAVSVCFPELIAKTLFKE